MKKCRIIERTGVDNIVKYVVQQKHFLFKWLWVDAWINSSVGASCRDSFATLKEAEDNLCYFNDTKIREKVCKVYK